MPTRKDLDDDEDLTDRVLRIAEAIIYSLASVLLVVGAIALLVVAGYHLATGYDDGVKDAVQQVLDDLLLVFILVELLAAVRATMHERRLVAEPFLLVGMIASIKEILVISVDAREKRGEALDEALMEIGVLGVLLLALSVATLLVRRKEREPAEADETDT